MPTTAHLSAALHSPWVRLALVLLALAALGACVALLAPGAAPTRTGTGPWGQMRIGR